MKYSIIFSVWVFALLLSSCSSLKVNSDYDREANFSAYKTYSFAEMDMERTNINDLNKKRLVNALKNEMNKKGLTESESADLEIHMHGVVENKWAATANTDYYGMGYPYYRRRIGWGNTYATATTSVDVQEYDQGTLIIDLVDVKEKSLVWQGVGTAILKNNPKNVEERINKAMAKIMAGFPPGS